MLEQDNAILSRQLQDLASRKGPIAEDGLRISRIRLTPYTGLYDKDHDGVAEQLIVYVQPLDQEADVVKAPGTMVIQVWDLAADPQEALIATWTVGPQELRNMWSATLLTINYRLVFERPARLPTDRPITIRAEFIDAMTGKAYTDQRLIQPH
jgi:hypothetical protein